MTFSCIIHPLEIKSEKASDKPFGARKETVFTLHVFTFHVVVYTFHVVERIFHVVECIYHDVECKMKRNKNGLEIGCLRFYNQIKTHRVLEDNATVMKSKRVFMNESTSSPTPLLGQKHRESLDE